MGEVIMDGLGCMSHSREIASFVDTGVEKKEAI